MGDTILWEEALTVEGRLRIQMHLSSSILSSDRSSLCHQAAAPIFAFSLSPMPSIWLQCAHGMAMRMQEYADYAHIREYANAEKISSTLGVPVSPNVDAFFEKNPRGLLDFFV